MKRIAIIGANGQVGTEVCLFLRAMPGLEVAPISRSRGGAAFLRRHGFECRIGVASDAEQARVLFEGCDLVADFSLPTGSAYEVRDQMRQLIPVAVSAAPAKVPYVYLSSITAFGFRDFNSDLRDYRFSRNSYGSCKRFGEALAHRACSASGRACHILRVGVVHGELQAVTREMVKRIRANTDCVASVPDCESYTVFAFSIAEALAAIARGKVEPDVYTLVSNPGWRWSDIHEYLAERAGIERPRYRLIGPDSAPPTARAAVGAVTRQAKGLLWRQKDLIQGYLSAKMPKFEHRLRAVYHRRNAAAEIRDGQRTSQFRPYGNNHTVVPGRRMEALSDSRQTMADATALLRGTLNGRLAGDPKREVSGERAR